MPVEFLTDEEANSYGRYNGPPSQAELERAFFLDDADKALIARRRGDHNRLGFSLQMTTVRSLGLFLADPLDVPSPVLEYLADQLTIADPSCVKRYTERRTTRFEHAEEIKGVLGLRDFAKAEHELIAWVDARAWTTGDGPKAIFNDAVAWLLERGVLLPGVTTLARLVAQVCDDATQQLWDTLSPAADVEAGRDAGATPGRTRRGPLLGPGALAQGPGRAVGQEPGEGADPGVGDHGRRARGAGVRHLRASSASRRPGPLRDGGQGAPAPPPPAVPEPGHAGGHRGVPRGQVHRRRPGAVRPVDGHRAAGKGRARGDQGEGPPAPPTGASLGQTGRCGRGAARSHEQGRDNRARRPVGADRGGRPPSRASGGHGRRHRDRPARGPGQRRGDAGGSGEAHRGGQRVPQVPDRGDRVRGDRRGSPGAGGHEAHTSPVVQPAQAHGRRHRRDVGARVVESPGVRQPAAGGRRDRQERLRVLRADAVPPPPPPPGHLRRGLGPVARPSGPAARRRGLGQRQGRGADRAVAPREP